MPYSDRTGGRSKGMNGKALLYLLQFYFGRRRPMMEKETFFERKRAKFYAGNNNS